MRVDGDASGVRGYISGGGEGVAEGYVLTYLGVSRIGAWRMTFVMTLEWSRILLIDPLNAVLIVIFVFLTCNNRNGVFIMRHLKDTKHLANHTTKAGA